MNQNINRNIRSGMSLLEIVVVLAVIGIIMMLLIPAVNAAREASRRMNCQNNLKQIGLALTNYQQSLNVYPFGVGGGGPPNKSPRWSCQSQLLLYNGNASIFNSINFSGVPWNHDELSGRVNSTALSTKIVQYLCPSDVDNISEVYEMAHNNYRACSGSLAYNLETVVNLVKVDNNGMFWFQSAISPGQIRDGFSNTAMFSERCLGNSQGPDTKSDYYIINKPGISCRDANASVLQRFTSFVEWSGQRWGDGNVFYTRYAHCLPPNSPSCMFGKEDDEGPVIVSATSRHIGGVNMMTADGAVRFVSEKINAMTWKALSTISGGEVVNTTEY